MTKKEFAEILRNDFEEDGQCACGCGQVFISSLKYGIKSEFLQFLMFQFFVVENYSSIKTNKISGLPISIMCLMLKLDYDK